MTLTITAFIEVYFTVLTCSFPQCANEMQAKVNSV
jgi:hypothetical protein